MKELIFIFLGSVILLSLSQIYYPSNTSMELSQSFMRQRLDGFLFIAVAWMTMFSCLRTNYNDTSNYIAAFRDAPSVSSWFAHREYTDLTGNPLSILYRNLIHDMTDNYHIYFLFPALLSSLSTVKLFKRYSVSPAFSILIFFSIGTYVLYIAALKQCLAMFFLLLAVPYAVDRKYIRFYLLVFVAVLFHTHAFLFAILPFLMGRPWGKVTWILLGMTLFAIATYEDTFTAFMEFAQSIGALVAEEEVFDGHQINVIRILVYWIPAILALIYREPLFCNSSRAENLFVNMSIISAFILSIGLAEGANLYARMAGYFEIATAIALPWMIQKLFTRQSVQYLTSIASFLYFGYFLYEFGISKAFGLDYRAISLWQFFSELIH